MHERYEDLKIVNIDQCWCGSQDLEKFSEHYYRCRECLTLVRSQRMSEEFYRSGDDANSYYGKEYWTEIWMKEYGHKDIMLLSRDFIAERCIYWLRNIMKYKLPPAKTLELGCSHGGLVFLMKRAGYESTGTEMSEWICDYARKTFDVAILCGRIEDINTAPKSLDIIVLMDVLEHLTDPVRSLNLIAEALKDDGVVVLQTPCWREAHKTYEEMKAENYFLLNHQLKEKEHFYLFSESSVKRILLETGFPHVEFEKPIFLFDMFVFAGKQPLYKMDKESVDASLLSTPDGRMVLALMDIYEKTEQKTGELFRCEADRKARLQVIEKQAKEHAEKLRELEAEKAARLQVTERIQKQYAECEADRKARLQVIEKQAKEHAEKMRELEMIKLSLSWRITAPFRWLLDMLKR
ncbi:MAG: methyltransferase domain-containing protein [Nitrospirota bacterium]